MLLQSTQSHRAQTLSVRQGSALTRLQRAAGQTDVQGWDGSFSELCWRGSPLQQGREQPPDDPSGRWWWPSVTQNQAGIGQASTLDGAAIEGHQQVGSTEDIEWLSSHLLFVSLTFQTSYFEYFIYARTQRLTYTQKRLSEKSFVLFSPDDYVVWYEELHSLKRVCACACVCACYRHRADSTKTGPFYTTEASPGFDSSADWLLNAIFFWRGRGRVFSCAGGVLKDRFMGQNRTLVLARPPLMESVWRLFAERLMNTTRSQIRHRGDGYIL